MLTRVKQFLRDEQGVTSIEYALLASLIAILIVAAVRTIGVQVCTMFGLVITGFGGGAPGC